MTPTASLSSRGEKARNGRNRAHLWWRFLQPILLWTSGSVALASIAWVVSPGSMNGDLGIWAGVGLVLGWIGLFLPFAMFAGGISFPRPVPTRMVGAMTLPVSLLLVLISGWGEPIAEYRDLAGRGGVVSRIFPMGPQTPVALLELRAAVTASPPDRFSFSASQPSARPPNWLLFSFCSFFTLAVFCFLSAFLGQLTAYVTMGLSPPARANLRWALGILTASGFLLSSGLAASWVRQDPANSGLVGAWMPLTLPLSELVFLFLLAKRLARAGTLRTTKGPVGAGL